MNTVLIILAFLCLIVGILGAIIPGLPGPPVSWVGLLLACLTPFVSCSPALLVVTAVLALIITVLDYVVPSLATKRQGGSKYGIWGCKILANFIVVLYDNQSLLSIHLQRRIFHERLIEFFFHCRNNLNGLLRLGNHFLWL